MKVKKILIDLIQRVKNMRGTTEVLDADALATKAAREIDAIYRSSRLDN